MKKLVLLTADSNGSYPVPAVKGGAVSTLVEHLIDDNEKSKLYNITVLSFYDKKAQEKAKLYKNTCFIWVKVPNILLIANKLLFKFIKRYFPHKKALSYRSIFSLLFYIIKSRSILKKFEFDNVIIENNIPLSISLWGLLSKYKGKYYYHLHNVPRINAGSKKVISKAAGYLCVSDYVGRQIKDVDNPIGPVNKKKISILRNCIDVHIFNENNDFGKINDIKRRLKISPTDKIILFSGRLSKEKGIDQLIKAFRVAYQKDQSLKLLIIGSYLHGSNIKTEYQDYLRELSNGLQNRIIYTGYISQLDLKYYYQIAKITVLPSMWDEPAGLTMLESMACGTPVITTYSGGIPEYVEDKAIVLERNQMLVKEIAKKIEYLLQNPDIYNKYSTEGSSFVVKKYSSEGYVNNLHKIIN